MNDDVETPRMHVLAVARSLPTTLLNRSVHLFVISGGLILLVTGVSKLDAVFGSSRVLDVHDPLLGVTFRTLLGVVAAWELLLGVGCVLSQCLLLRLALLTWTATGFLFYRVSLWLLEWKKPCGCLGGFGQMFGISERALDHIATVILCYLFLGGYGCLIALRLQRDETK